MKNINFLTKKLILLKDKIVQQIKGIRYKITPLNSMKQAQAIKCKNTEILKPLRTISDQEMIMINSALKRIDSGEYFSCNICGEIIPAIRF